METIIPKTSTAAIGTLKALTLPPNGATAVHPKIVLLIPVIILVSWKGLVEKLGGPLRAFKQPLFMV